MLGKKIYLLVDDSSSEYVPKIAVSSKRQAEKFLKEGGEDNEGLHYIEIRLFLFTFTAVNYIIYSLKKQLKAMKKETARLERDHEILKQMMELDEAKNIGDDIKALEKLAEISDTFAGRKFK